MRKQVRRTRAVVLAGVASSLLLHAAPPVEPDAGVLWEVVFEDDFDGDKLDRDAWDPFYNWGGSSEDHRHNYDGYAIDEYAIVEDGLLRLKCTKNSDDPHEHDQTYSVGVVSSRFTYKYGYIEGRFKLPHGYTNEYNGLWPAFWSAAAHEEWPEGGEIDIFEFFGHNHVWDATIHWNSSGGHQQSGFDHKVADATQAFHTYGAHWHNGAVDFYLDNEYVKTISFPDFDHEHFLMINFGIHGPGDDHDWLGDASGNEELMPLYLESDFVRIWQREDDGTTGAGGKSRSPHAANKRARPVRGRSPGVAFALGAGQAVSAALYDALGNRIARRNGRFAPGDHQVVFSGDALRAGPASAVYFITVTGETFNTIVQVVPGQ
jgi:beta-glucanase (GH16 family)